MIITVLTVCNIFMVSCSLKKSLYLKGQPLIRNSNMSHFIAPAPSSVSIYSQIKALENTKRNNPKFERIVVKTNSEKQKNEFETVLKNENLTYGIGDSVKLELNNGKVYFAVITKIEQEGYFIKVNNKRNIYISKKEIKKITVIKKADKNESNKANTKQSEILSYNNKPLDNKIKPKNGWKNFGFGVLNALKIVGKIVLVVLATVSVLILILLIAIFL